MRDPAVHAWEGARGPSTSENPRARVAATPRVCPHATARVARLARRARILGLSLLAIVACAPASRGDGLVRPADVLASYGVLDGWVRGWRVPPEPVRADPDGATGASVTLRLGGEVLGRGSSVREDGLAVWAAAVEAWREADDGLVVGDEPPDPSRVEALARRVTIDLEVGGELAPIVGETFAAATAPLSPGLVGLAMRAGDEYAGVFPGTQLSIDMAPRSALRACAGRLGLPPLPLGRLAREHGAVAYAFSSVHLAQVTPGRPPTFLRRGGSLAPSSAVSGAGLRRLADDIASHVLLREWAGDASLGLHGDYRPTLGAFRADGRGAA